VRAVSAKEKSMDTGILIAWAAFRRETPQEFVRCTIDKRRFSTVAIM
jgi:hypothetical protein